jgi:hypothetical protein
VRFKVLLTLLFLALLVVSGVSLAAGQRAEKHSRHLYVGTVSSLNSPAKLQIEFDYGDPSLGRLNNSTWIDWVEITTLSSTVSGACKGQGPWGWHGAERVRNKSFSYKYAPGWANKNGYVDLLVIHGKVSGWEKKKLSWRKVTGTVRLAEASPTYTDSYDVVHPAYHCDQTYHWSALRRG